MRRIAPFASEKRRIDWSTLSVTHAESDATVRALGAGPTGASEVILPAIGSTRTRRPPPVIVTVVQTALPAFWIAVARPGSGPADVT